MVVAPFGGSARTKATPAQWSFYSSLVPSDTWRRLVGAAIALNLAAAPVSWIDDGITPSWIVYPVLLIVGAVLLARGRTWAFAYLAVIAAVFVLVHLPFSLAPLFGHDNPYDSDKEYSPVQWTITLLVVPLVLLAASVGAWRDARRPKEPLLA